MGTFYINNEKERLTINIDLLPELKMMLIGRGRIQSSISTSITPTQNALPLQAPSTSSNTFAITMTTPIAANRLANFGALMSTCVPQSLPLADNMSKMPPDAPDTQRIISSISGSILGWQNGKCHVTISFVANVGNTNQPGTITFSTTHMAFDCFFTTEILQSIFDKFSNRASTSNAKWG